MLGDMHFPPSHVPRPGMSQSASTRWLIASLIGMALFGLHGCRPTDPLESIRADQASGDFAATIEPLRELLRIQPKDAETNYLYGRALVATQHPELALYALRQAMEDPEWRKRAGFQLGYAGLASEDFNEVVRSMDRILDSDPDDLDALLLRAQANAHWKKDPESALEDAQTVLDADPDRLEAYEPLILAFLALDRRQEADEALATAGRRLIDTDAPESARAWHCSTTAIFAEGDEDPERARTSWEKCLAAFPTDATVVSEAIRFFDERRDFGRSLEIAQAAHRGAPESRIYRGTLAGRLLLAGRVDEARTILSKATESKQPKAAAEAWTDLGELLHRIGEYEEAAEAFGEAVRRTEPRDPQLSFRYADALVLAGELDRALEQGEKLDIEAHRHLIRARVEQERGDDERALADFGEASRLWPDNPWARYFAARSAERLGLWDRALEEYRYSIRIDTAATDARTRAARLLAAQGQLLPAYHLLFLKAEEIPLDPEGEILGAYLIARASNASQLQDALQKHLFKHPETYPRALIRAAEGLAEDGKVAAAKNLLQGAPGIVLVGGQHAAVLSAFVRYAHAVGASSEAAEAVSAALDAAPNAAGYHVAHGLDLELGGASDAEIRSAYSRAIELDPRNADALEALGRSSLEDDPPQALAWFEKATDVDPTRETARMGAAVALISMDRIDAAAERLDGIIEANPFFAEAVRKRVDLDLDRSQVTTRTLELARRSVRLGGRRNPADYDRLSRVLGELGDAERAGIAAEAAKKLRNMNPG